MITAKDRRAARRSERFGSLHEQLERRSRLHTRLYGMFPPRESERARYTLLRSMLWIKEQRIAKMAQDIASKEAIAWKQFSDSLKTAFGSPSPNPIGV